MTDSDKVLVFNFFHTFARFEYALKASGYCTPGKIEAEPDWDKFGNDLAALDSGQFAETLTKGHYILNNEPQKQIVIQRPDGSRVLSWKTSRPTAKPIKVLIIYVGRIRNNLFHGGKFPMLLDRDRQLLEDGVSVLTALLAVPSLPADVKENFYK